MLNIALLYFESIIISSSFILYQLFNTFMNSTEKAIEQLRQLNLNNLESEVYLHLLTNEPMTAYKVGKGIGKPTANVYKAIESLSLKGAVVVEDNKNKLCKAISPDEFINHFEKSLLKSTENARTLLKDLNSSSIDENTYSIESIALVFEKFSSMLEKCKEIAVIDAFPIALNHVLEPIKKAIERGVDVHIEAYKSIEIEGANIACSNISEKAADHWDGQQLNLVIDGEEHLIALMNNELSEVKQASWSNNVYSSCMMHAGRICENTVIKIMSKMDSENFEADVKQIMNEQKFFFNSRVPGFNKLFPNK